MWRMRGRKERGAVDCGFERGETWRERFWERGGGGEKWSGKNRGRGEDGVVEVGDELGDEGGEGGREVSSRRERHYWKMILRISV